MSDSYTEIVRQAILLLADISVKEYQQKLPPHFPSSIGSHVRHIVDHFLALQEGHKKGHVDYNVRHRNNQIEQFPEAAKDALNDISNWLENIQEHALDKPLTISSDIDETSYAFCSSTLKRELVFVSSHAIHHYALIHIMCSMQNLGVPTFFGYTPSTVTHLRKTN